MMSYFRSLLAGLLCLVTAALPAQSDFLINPYRFAATTPDLLVCLFSTGGSGTTTISFPAGWTAGTTQQNTNISTNWAYKVANDTGNITVTTGASKPGAYNCYRITGYTGTPTATLSNSGGSTSTPNPPSHTSGFGAVSTLWIAGAGMQADASGDTFSAAPTNYTNLLQSGEDTGDFAVLGSARRFVSAASEDPGTFTYAASKRDTVITVAVEGDGGNPTVDSTSVGKTASSTSHTVTLP